MKYSDVLKFVLIYYKILNSGDTSAENCKNSVASEGVSLCLCFVFVTLPHGMELVLRLIELLYGM